MQNVEYKTELRDRLIARSTLRMMKALPIITVRQEDTYYRLPDGRLLRREAEGEPVEWIFYHRTDRVRPRMSTFSILTDEQARNRWGVLGLTAWLRVEKTRELHMIENVAIALDQVDGLGDFVEFTAMVSGEADVAECHLKIDELRTRFGPALGEPIGLGYSDLMAAEAVA